MKPIIVALFILAYPLYSAIYEQHKITDYLFLERLDYFITNTSNQPIDIYSERDPFGTSIGKLSATETAQFLYAGKNGQYWYGMKDNQKFAIKSSDKALSLRLFDTYMPLSFFAWLILTLFIAPMLWLGAIKVMPGMRILLKGGDEVARLQAENHLLRERVKTLQNDNNNLHYKAINKEQEASRLDQKRAQAERKARRYEQAHQSKANETVELIRSFREKEMQWLEQVDKESEKRTNVRIQDMQASYDRLNNRFNALQADHNRILEHGIVFDIDFKSDKYEGILKGRQFEIYFAKLLTKNCDIEILEWTSDKGTQNNLTVASNNNPDFLFRYDNRIDFAVECKYRSKLFGDYNINKERIDWTNIRQVEHYVNYGKNHSVPVFVAIGLEGQATQPKQTFLIPLDQLTELSYEYSKRNIKTPLLLVPQEKIKGFSRAPHNIASELESDLYLSRVLN